MRWVFSILVFTLVVGVGAIATDVNQTSEIASPQTNGNLEVVEIAPPPIGRSQVIAEIAPPPIGRSQVIAEYAPPLLGSVLV